MAHRRITRSRGTRSSFEGNDTQGAMLSEPSRPYRHHSEREIFQEIKAWENGIRHFEAKRRRLDPTDQDGDNSLFESIQYNYSQIRPLREELEHRRNDRARSERASSKENAQTPTG